MDLVLQSNIPRPTSILVTKVLHAVMSNCYSSLNLSSASVYLLQQVHVKPPSCFTMFPSAGMLFNTRGCSTVALISAFAHLILNGIYANTIHTDSVVRSLLRGHLK